MVIPSLNPTQGGVVSAVRMLCKELANQGHRPTILTFDDPNQEWLKACDNIVAVGPSCGKYGLSLYAVKWIRCNRLEYDVIIVNGLWQFPGVAVCLALTGSSVPYYVFPHGMLDPWFNKNYPLKWFKKILYWLIAERWVLYMAEAVVFTSEDERALSSGSFRFSHHRSVVAPLGVPKPPTDSLSLSQSFLLKYPNNHT